MKIQPVQSVQLPLLGIVDNLEIRVNSFPLFPSSIEVFWKVSGETASKEGTITLPQDIVDVWGTDDTVVKDYVLQQLGLIEEVTVEDITPEPAIETPPTEEVIEPSIETPPTEEVIEPIIETPPTEEIPQ